MPVKTKTELNRPRSSWFGNAKWY